MYMLTYHMCSLTTFTQTFLTQETHYLTAVKVWKDLCRVDFNE